jgi:SPP1 gp7 family putative phage head morphogenesis protein
MLLLQTCPACSSGECLTHGLNKAFGVDDLLRLIDWAAISDDIREELETAAEAGVTDAFIQLDVQDTKLVGQANIAARDYAKERAAELVGSGDQSIAESTRSDLRDLLTASFEENTTAEDLIQSIQDSGLFSEARAKMIARTEVNRAEIGGNLAAYDEMGVELVDWVNGEAACDECQGYEDGGPYTLEEANALLDETHPNCRCGIVPNLGGE